ncbi:hypothetical protein BLNAU_5126 [Blattamonas nauphoetae]|uniref:Uncharacterized protein n=1 Tax=Blattamonas nauphoetae TaxID=2049346 RepID=A0ABQ9Y8D7_9EUKA|nr:hypothetical protein BLNAU_5126 [Blattamonas nauphoetae]
MKTLRRSKQFKLEGEVQTCLTNDSSLQASARSREEVLVSTVNDLLNTMKTEDDHAMSHSLAKLSSMTRLAGFCSVFVELNGIEELVSLKSRLVQEDSAKTLFELICGLSFYGSEAAIPLLTSPIPNDLVDLLQTSDTGTTELILKTLVNIGVDNRELFRSQLGATLLQSISLLLQKSLRIHHQHLFTQDGIVFIGKSLQDKITKPCLNLLILVMERSELFRLDNEDVQLIVSLLRHCSTDIVLLLLRTLRTLTSNSHYARTRKQNIQVAQIDGNTKPIPMIQLVTELFGAYLNRLRTQIEQIQTIWTTEPDNAMLLDRNTSSGGTDASEPLDVVKLTTQISATCEVLRGLSHLFSCAVFWEKKLHEMLLDSEMLRLFGEFFSFCRKTIELENSLQKQNPTIELSWMDSRTTIRNDTTCIAHYCMVGMMKLYRLSRDQSHLFFKAIYPQHRNPHQHFFSVLSALLAFGVPNLAQPIVFIVNTILFWKDSDYLSLLISGLIEVLFRYVIKQDIDDEQTEKTLMQIATRILSRGEKGDSKSYQPPEIERDSAHRLSVLLAQSQFVEMMEKRSPMRTERWTMEFRLLRHFCSKFEKTYTDLSSPHVAFSIDCVPFLSWSEDLKGSWFGQTVVFQSLIATLKLQLVLDESLETKAAKFLKSMDTQITESTDDLLSAHVSNSDGSLTDFVKSLLVLFASPNQAIKAATLEMLNGLICVCSAKSLLALVKADLIGQLVLTLNPLSLSLAEAEDIHTCLIQIISNSVWLATQDGLKKLKIEDLDEHQSVRETVLKQVLAPSENRFQRQKERPKRRCGSVRDNNTAIFEKGGHRRLDRGKADEQQKLRQRKPDCCQHDQMEQHVGHELFTTIVETAKNCLLFPTFFDLFGQHCLCVGFVRSGITSPLPGERQKHQTTLFSSQIMSNDRLCYCTSTFGRKGVIYVIRVKMNLFILHVLVQTVISTEFLLRDPAAEFPISRDLSSLLQSKRNWNSTQNNEHGIDIILAEGTYFGRNCAVHSETVDFSGCQSILAFEPKPSSKSSLNQKQNTETRHGKIPEAILDILNSTVRIREMILEVDQKETSIATIRASSTTISNCEVITMASMSPFVIVDDTSLMKSWLTVVSSSQKNAQDSNVLLPLVGLIALPADPTSQHGDNSDCCEEAGLFEHSIVGHGLSTSSAHLGLGTGPLFDFGRKGNALHTPTCGFEVSLYSSRIWNTTSEKVASRGLGMVVTQRGIGCSVSQSTNHLSGTSGMNLNWAGHALLSNSSFSSCHSSSIEDLDPVTPPNPPSDPEAIQTYEGEEEAPQISFAAESVKGNEIWINQCFFQDLTDQFGGAIQLSEVQATVTIHTSSFYNCRATTSSGGGLYAQFNDQSDQTMLLFGVELSGCTASMYGGSAFIQNYQTVTVADSQLVCSFTTDMGFPEQLDSFYHYSTASLRVDNSSFSMNTGLNTGAMSLDTRSQSVCEWILTDVLFFENECKATNEEYHVNDVVVSHAGILQTAHCFSTSMNPKCGRKNAAELFVDAIGPTITKIVVEPELTIEDGVFKFGLRMEGVFTGTPKRFDFKVQHESDAVIVLKKLQFDFSKSHLKGIFLNHPTEEESLDFNTEYSLNNVELTQPDSASNAFELGESYNEPEWNWWHHTHNADKTLKTMSFTTPKGPTLTGITAKKDPSDENQVTLSLAVNMILGGEYTLVVFEESDTSETPITIKPVAFTDSTTETTGTVTVPLNGVGQLASGTTYKVKSLKSTTLTVLHDSQTFHTPDAPQLTGVPFSFLTTAHTTFKLVLEGKDLPEGETYLVKLDGFTPTIAVTFSSSKRGESEELALGWTDTLQFDTSYTLASVTLSSDQSITIDTNSLVLTTLAQPEPLVLDVGESAHTNAKFCGDSARPCSSVDVAWKTIAQYSPLATSLRVARSLSLLSSVESRKGSVVKIENQAVPPTLVIPSTASLGDSAGLVSVAGALFLGKVNIDV